ncbi:MAG TPA: DUF4249 domain-containing protein [Mucilaginibacter sp.]|jgi:hypothetical protein|nr:DUF4249 domain-containing protein [Mucilaginibacter sp.]
MKRFKFCLVFLAVTLTFAACTKVIDLKLGNDSGKLVIEGNITNLDSPQYIKLSRNVPFTSTNTYPPVSGATVTVSDNKNNIYTFTEGPAGTYSSAQFPGVSGNTYQMTVVTGGTTYKANSVMPALVPFDSITYKKADFKSGNNRREITVHYQDQAGIPNQYRFIMWVNSVEVSAVFAYDDEFSDGRYVDQDLVENTTDIYPGDTVKVEMQCIDKPVYTYWFTLMEQGFGGPDGGVAPSNPPTNITPAVLGYFSAHTTQAKTIIVQ